MTPIFSSTRDFLSFAVEALLILVAIAAAWLFYRYVRSVMTQNRLAAARQLAETAIDYVEDLDRRGDLNVPSGTDKGAWKRQLAAQWLRTEMQSDGVQMAPEQAQKWIAAAFQKRAGDSQPAGRMGELAQEAVDLTQALERAHLIEPPSSMDRHLYLAALAADWITLKLAKEGMAVSHDQAMTWVRGEILHRLQVQAGESSNEQRLNQMAIEAVQFAGKLQASGRLGIRAGTAGENVEADVATAWLVKEAAEQGLQVTTDQIAETIANALAHRDQTPVIALTANLAREG